jgi:integrase
MPRLKTAVPKFRVHKASGRALVTLHGVDHYLGPADCPKSRQKYDGLIAEYLANARKPVATSDEATETTVLEVLAAYIEHATTYYRKNGEPTSELDAMKIVVRDIKADFAALPVSKFGPAALKQVRQRWIDRGLTRTGVNKCHFRAIRIFRWAVAEEMAPASLVHSLEAVATLRQGRCNLPEPPPILPVDDATVDATIPHLPVVVADMIEFQRLTGARPGEVCKLTPGAVDRSGDVWQYRVAGHKTEHHGRQRIIHIGPKAQKLIAPYLLRDARTACFSPREVVERLNAERRESRVTPLGAGNAPGRRSNASDKLKGGKPRSPGEAYTTRSYARAIARACDRAFPAPKGTTGERLQKWRADHRWAPNQLRHAYGTSVRKQFGLEAVQVSLGHASAEVTQIYAERDLAKAAEVARLIG